MVWPKKNLTFQKKNKKLRLNYGLLSSMSAGSFLVYLFIALFICYFSYITVTIFIKSVLLTRPERVTLVFYKDKPKILSLGLRDNINYVIDFDNNLYLNVPGGYKVYKVGSIGKLAEIEKDPKIVANAFSSAISAHVGYYFMDNKQDVYHSSDQSESLQFSRSQLLYMLANLGNTTNASVFDRIYFIIKTIQLKNNSLIDIRNIPAVKRNDKAQISESGFQKKYAGFFYHQIFRKEGLDIKLIYNSYSGAKTISRVIEGQGIRVVDLQKDSLSVRKQCVIKADTKYKNKSIRSLNFLRIFFKCAVVYENVIGAQVAVYLNDDIESSWE